MFFFSSEKYCQVYFVVVVVVVEVDGVDDVVVVSETGVK